MQAMKNNETAVKYRAIKYIRLSQADDNPGESDSIANQRRIIDDFLKKHPEIEVVGEKIDDGWSGIIFDRPGFNEMMEEFKEGKANCCVTKDLSRFGREFIETGRHLRYIFPSLGVRFIAITDKVDTLTDRGDDLIISIKTIINDSYCQDISIKTRSALAAKRANGEYVGSFPIYGYKKAEDNRNQLVIDEYPGEIVRDIFRMKIEGLSAGRIADTLNSKGVLSPYQYKKINGLPHPRNGYADKEETKWSAKTILRILKDETYTGTLIQGISGTPNYKIKEVFIKPAEEWKRVEKTHEAIVSRHTFDITQKVLLLDTRTAPNCDSVYIFSGLLICGYCGGRMHRKSASYKGNRTQYYYCRAPKKHGCDSSFMINEDGFIKFMFKSVKSHISNVTKLEHAIADISTDRMTRQLTKNLNARINENNRQLETIHSFEAGLYEMMLSGDLTKKEYEFMKARYTEEAAVFIADNESLRHEINGAPEYKHEQMEWIENFREFADINALDRRAVANLIQGITIKSKTDIEIVFHYQSQYQTALALIKAAD